VKRPSGSGSYAEERGSVRLLLKEKRHGQGKRKDGLKLHPRGKKSFNRGSETILQSLGHYSLTLSPRGGFGYRRSEGGPSEGSTALVVDSG